MNKYTLTNDYGVSQTPITEEGKNFILIECELNRVNCNISIKDFTSTDEIKKGFKGHYGIEFKYITPEYLYSFLYE